MKKYLPAWKDKNGNRMICVAENHVFDNHDDARQYQLSEFIFYIPYGITPDGVFEAEFDGSIASFPHVLFSGPFASTWAGIDGPALNAATESQASEVAP